MSPSNPGSERSQFKQAVLAGQDGMEAESLAARVGQPVIGARELLDLHRRTYSAYWVG
jgi:DNA polymerase-1